MGGISLSLNINLMHREKVAQIGDLQVISSYYSIENPKVGFSDEAIILSSKEHIYINFEDAIQWTGIDPEILTKLCIENEIEAIQTENSWIILWSSLRSYIHKKK